MRVQIVYDKSNVNVWGGCFMSKMPLLMHDKTQESIYMIDKSKKLSGYHTYCVFSRRQHFYVRAAARLTCHALRRFVETEKQHKITTADQQHDTGTVLHERRETLLLVCTARAYCRVDPLGTNNGLRRPRGFPQTISQQIIGQPRTK